jgi:hypothetical protein
VRKPLLGVETNIKIGNDARTRTTTFLREYRMTWIAAQGKQGVSGRFDDQEIKG